MTGNGGVCASPCLRPCYSLNTSFRLTNQCRTLFSAPNLLRRPASSSHVGACLSTVRWSFFTASPELAPANLLPQQASSSHFNACLSTPHFCFFAVQLGSAPVTLLPSTPHTRAVLKASFARPEGRPLSCPPPPAPQISRVSVRPSHGSRARRHLFPSRNFKDLPPPRLLMLPSPPAQGTSAQACRHLLLVVGGMVNGRTPSRFARGRVWLFGRAPVARFRRRAWLGCAPDGFWFNGLTIRPFLFSPV